MKKLSSEGLNSEGAAIFALLVLRKNRPKLVRLIVAYQVMYDYLDGVNEEPAFSTLRDGLRLHHALLNTLWPDVNQADYYERHLEHDDGDYLDALVHACRNALNALPAKTVVKPTLAIALKRCSEAQAHNHARVAEGDKQLIDWSSKQASDGRYLWWELSAAGVSSLALHALLAAAATPGMTRDEAQLIDAVYFPAVCAISALLDSLIDIERDRDTASHSFTSHYTSSTLTARRCAAIVTDAESQIDRLRQAQQHKILLTGVLGYYLSAREAHTEYARAVMNNVKNAVSTTIWPVLVVMRIRRSKGVGLSSQRSHKMVSGSNKLNY